MLPLRGRFPEKTLLEEEHKYSLGRLGELAEGRAAL